MELLRQGLKSLLGGREKNQPVAPREGNALDADRGAEDAAKHRGVRVGVASAGDDGLEGGFEIGGMGQPGLDDHRDSVEDVATDTTRLSQRIRELGRGLASAGGFDGLFNEFQELMAGGGIGGERMSAQPVEELVGIDGGGIGGAAGGEGDGECPDFGFGVGVGDARVAVDEIDEVLVVPGKEA